MPLAFYICAGITALFLIFELVQIVSRLYDIHNDLCNINIQMLRLSIREAKTTKQLANNFKQNCRAAFKDASYDDFQAKLKRAVDNGLAEVLDQAPAVRDFVFSQPSGAKVLDAMLNDRDTFLRIMRNADKNPTLATEEMHKLARELEKPVKKDRTEATKRYNRTHRLVLDRKLGKHRWVKKSECHRELNLATGKEIWVANA